MTHGLNGNDPARRRGRNRKRIEPAQAESLFDSQGTPSDGGAEGRRRRDEGAQQAVHGSPAVARLAGEEGIRRLARERDTFSADDLHALLEAEGGPTIPSKACGGLFLAAAHRGEIKAVGWTTSERPSRHGGPQRLWTGVDV